MFKKNQKPSIQSGRQRLSPPINKGAVFSYHAKRSERNAGLGRDAEQETVKPVQRARRKRWWHKLSNLLLLALVAALLVSSLELQTTPKVVFVGDESGQIFLQDKKIYSQAAHKLFASSPANANKVTVNTGGVAKGMRERFPELAGVSVSLPVVGHRPVVYLQPAMPRLVLTASDGDSYVVDRSGRALISTTQVGRMDELAVPTVNDQSGLSLRAGQSVLESNTVAFITEVVGQLKAKNVPISSLALPQGTSELAVGIQGVPYTAKFNLRGNAREEAGTLLAVKQQLESQGVQPGQYIDVRVSGRAYYK